MINFYKKSASGSQIINITGDTVNGDPVVSNISDVSKLDAGMSVEGVGIPVGTTIFVLGPAADEVTLTNNATADGTAVALTVNSGTDYLTMPIWDLNDSPLTEAADDPTAHAVWGLNDSFREIADKIIDLDGRITDENIWDSSGGVVSLHVPGSTLDLGASTILSTGILNIDQINLNRLSGNIIIDHAVTFTMYSLNPTEMAAIDDLDLKTTKKTIFGAINELYDNTVSYGTHNNLIGLNVGDYKHLTAIEYAALTGLGDTSLHIHDSRYYTESEINLIISFYYTSIQIDTLFLNYYTASQVDTLFTSYYTASQIDTTLLNYYTSSQVDTLFTSYYTSSQVDTLFTGYYTSTQVDTLLTGYSLTSHTHSTFGALSITDDMTFTSGKKIKLGTSELYGGSGTVNWIGGGDNLIIDRFTSIIINYGLAPNEAGIKMTAGLVQIMQSGASVLDMSASVVNPKVETYFTTRAKFYNDVGLYFGTSDQHLIKHNNSADRLEFYQGLNLRFYNFDSSSLIKGWRTKRDTDSTAGDGQSVGYYLYKADGTTLLGGISSDKYNILTLSASANRLQLTSLTSDVRIDAAADIRVNPATNKSLVLNYFYLDVDVDFRKSTSGSWCTYDGGADTVQYNSTIFNVYQGTRYFHIGSENYSLFSGFDLMRLTHTGGVYVEGYGDYNKRWHLGATEAGNLGYLRQYGTGMDFEIVVENGNLILNPSGTVKMTARNFEFGTTTGTKFGTDTSQKMGWWNTTPVVQPTTATYGAWTTLSNVVSALQALGILGT